MNLLLTGGRGFLGTYLTETLEEMGHNVMAIDREDGDLTQPGVFLSILNLNPIDMVVHLAAQPGRVFGEDDKIATINNNIGMTTLVAEACGLMGVRLCYISTSEVYGPSYSWRSELDTNLRPNNLYGLTKLCGEQVSELYAPDDLLIIRPTMPYGPGMKVGRGRAALPTMISNALHGDEIEVHEGTIRSWCYITDLINGMVDVIEKGHEKIYNVGRDDDAIYMLEVARRACDLTGASRDLIRLVPCPGIVTPAKHIMTSRLESLGWEPEVSLEEGMTLTMNYLMNRMEV